MPALTAAMLALGLMAGPAARAQTPPGDLRFHLPPTVEPGRERPPSLPEPSDGNFDFSITAPRRSAVPRSVDELRFAVNGIRVEGATVFPVEKLADLIDPLVGRTVGLSDILTLAERIEARYRESGYILTRAFVPPQRTSDGVFTIRVVEGYIKALAVEGGDETTRERIESILRPILRSRPLDQSTLERALLLANDLPGLQSSGLVRPSQDEPGAADLVVMVTQTPWAAAVSVDNYASKFAGPWQATATASINSPLGLGEQFTVAASVSRRPEEQNSFTARYLQPLGTNGMTLSLSALRGHGQPGATLQPLNVHTTSDVYSARIGYPILRSRAHTLLVDGGFTWLSSDVRMLDQPYSHDEWRVLDLAGTWVQNGWLDGAMSVTLGVAKGLPFLGASSPDARDLSRPGANPAFTKLTAALRRAQALFGPLSLSLVAQGQYSFDKLLSGERFGVGGRQFGRGYDPSAVTGDHGAGATVELRYTMSLEEIYLSSVTGYLFFDTGRVWDRGGGFAATLASTGVGLRMALPYNLGASVEVARPLRALPGVIDSHPATRILFGLDARF